MRKVVLDNGKWCFRGFFILRQNSSAGFQDVVPTATSENIATLANILFDQSYTPMLNEFVSNLINRIGLQWYKIKYSITL